MAGERDRTGVHKPLAAKAGGTEGGVIVLEGGREAGRERGREEWRESEESQTKM